MVPWVALWSVIVAFPYGAWVGRWFVIVAFPYGAMGCSVVCDCGISLRCHGLVCGL